MTFGSLRFSEGRWLATPPINQKHLPWTSSARSTLRALRLARRFWFFPPNKWLIHCLVHWRQFWRQVESKMKNIRDLVNIPVGIPLLVYFLHHDYTCWFDLLLETSRNFQHFQHPHLPLSGLPSSSPDTATSAKCSVHAHQFLTKMIHILSQT